MTTIGVVGCGYWGAKHLRSLHELGCGQVVACDSAGDRLTDVQRRYPSVTTTRRFDDLLDTNVDAIIIATPISTHFDLARRALLDGRDVLVEKPLAASAEQAEELVEIAEQNRAVLMVGHTYVYNPAVDAVLASIASGDLGDIYYVDLARLNLGLFQHDANVLWDLAPHDLSMLLYLLEQSPVEISAHGAAHVNRRVHDNVHLDLIFSGGTGAHVHVSWLEPCKIRRVTVVGARKMIVYDDVAPTEKVWIYDRGVSFQHDPDTSDDFNLSYRRGDTTILSTPADEPLQIEQKHFLDCIKERRRPKSDGFAGLEVVTLLECAQRSLDHEGIPIRVRDLMDRPAPWPGAGIEHIGQIRQARAESRSGAIAPPTSRST